MTTIYRLLSAGALFLLICAFTTPKIHQEIKYGVLRGDLLPVIEAAVPAARRWGLDVSKYRIYVYDEGQIYVVFFADGDYFDNIRTNPFGPVKLRMIEVEVSKSNLGVGKVTGIK